MRIINIYLIVLAATLLGGCVPPPSGQPAVIGQGENLKPDLIRLQKEQAEISRQLQRLQDNLLLLEGRLYDQQQILQEMRATAPQKVTPGGQKAGSSLISPGIAPPAGSTSAASPTEVYLQAFADYASGRCPAAITGFQEFLRLYPGNDYAGHALFWLGECFYAQQQYPEAADAFRQAAQKFPRGGKAPDALMRLAESLQQLNRSTEADEVLQMLQQQYPESAAARRAMTD